MKTKPMIRFRFNLLLSGYITYIAYNWKSQVKVFFLPYSCFYVDMQISDLHELVLKANPASLIALHNLFSSKWKTLYSQYTHLMFPNTCDLSNKNSHLFQKYYFSCRIVFYSHQGDDRVWGKHNIRSGY